ncbi:hypothetical protein FB451DRAFT_1290055 [Mycena latifolia]|nr:hypothetical protein FB451DRAFT_1290055 [Mycena latifolia]
MWGGCLGMYIFLSPHSSFTFPTPAVDTPRAVHTVPTMLSISRGYCFAGRAYSQHFGCAFDCRGSKRCRHKSRT